VLRVSLTASLALLSCSGVNAEILEYSGSPEALDHARYVNVVNEDRSPVLRTYIKSKDGAYVAAAVRKPAGDGPFPAIVMFHGAPGGRGMEQLVGWSRGDHGGPVWERFLEEGFVVVVSDYRGGDFNVVNQPSDLGVTTAIDDGVAVLEHVAALPYVDTGRISVYGVSLGGNLVLFLASKMPNLHAVVAGAPAPFWFMGGQASFGGDTPFQPNTAVMAANIAPIRAPILIQAGTADPLLAIGRELHEQLSAAGKRVRMEVYEHGYHDFVLGPQGHVRPDLPNGEILMQATLDALKRSVDFVRSGQL